jgi:hypothetical protein
MPPRQTGIPAVKTSNAELALPFPGRVAPRSDERILLRWKPLQAFHRRLPWPGRQLECELSLVQRAIWREKR